MDWEVQTMTNPDLIGFSPKFRAVLDEIQLVAPADCTVLLRGETGTGKEVVARAIHEASPRRTGRFVAFNCAAIPSGLIESELFGYERGAFTGAVSQSIGRFQSADGGTLFLDEIGDLPVELQPKLLRALQERQFERLGGGRTVAVNVRVIAATHQNLWKMVQDRSFRADLFYRLNVFPIALPPLRERREDIPALVEHFVKTYAARQGKSIENIPDHVMEDLKRQEWHGNIRELQNCIERAVILSSGTRLRLPAIESSLEEAPGRTLDDIVKFHIIETLRERNWTVGGPGGAAALLGIPRTTLLAKMRKLGIARPAPAQPTLVRPESAGVGFPGEFAATARA
jgi:formate hydrogenlyase transcriptional activator